MGLKGLACIAAVAIAAIAVAPAAEAQSRKQQAATPSSQNTVFITRDENGRTTTRVIVTPRSYLDGGTEVLPGQRKFNHRDMEPCWSPIDILGPGKTYERQPLQPAWNSGGTRCLLLMIESGGRNATRRRHRWQIMRTKPTNVFQSHSLEYRDQVLGAIRAPFDPGISAVERTTISAVH